jgi:hypothetical protein
MIISISLAPMFIKIARRLFKGRSEKEKNVAAALEMFSLFIEIYWSVVEAILKYY